MDAALTISARWIFPVVGAPLAEGSITIQGQKIVCAEQGPSRQVDLDLGNVAILPGFVNAHTHLDLSGAAGLIPPTCNFTAWLRQVIAFRRLQSSAQISQAIEAGLQVCLRSGTTLLGDISSGGVSWDALASAPLRAVVFYELLGLSKTRGEQSRCDAEAWLSTHSATRTCRPGLSPHAPYSVGRELFQWATQKSLPLAVHVAESAAEQELLDHRQGPFVDFLRELGVWDPAGLVTSTELLELMPNAALIHGHHLGPMKSGQKLVVCPRTSFAFGEEFTDRYARSTALGTDSLASNPDLDILREARWMARSHPGHDILRQLTLGGASVLGWADEVGSLEPGKSADLVVLPLPDRDESDPHRLIFDSQLPVRGVMFRGQWSFGP